jgi:hypothetical protein
VPPRDVDLGHDLGGGGAGGSTVMAVRSPMTSRSEPVKEPTPVSTSSPAALARWTSTSP